MSLGVTTNIGRVNQGDSAELWAGLTQKEVPIDPDDVVSVSYTVQLPDATMTTQYGEVTEDGNGFLRFFNTAQTGEYRAVATFTLLSGEIRSVVINFFVEDPFQLTAETNEQIVVDQVWLRLEDCFDSVVGGPWLKDITYNNFDQTKITDFIPQAVFDINVQMPTTTATLSDFTTPNQDGTPNVNLPLLTQGLLVRTVMHLIRSYIEQPVPANNPVAYEDRTRYNTAWKAYYDMEYNDYMMNLRLWKRQFYNFGNSALLVSSKAGRVWPGASYRSQNVGRFGF